MLPLASFIALPEEDREGKFPFIWAVDKKNHLTRLMVAKPIVDACEERQHFWTMLKAISGVKPAQEVMPTVDLEQKLRSEIVGKIAQGLMDLAGGKGTTLAAVAQAAATPSHTEPESRPQEASAPQTTVAPQTPSPAEASEFLEPWIDSEDCTGCDECITINKNIFVYNDDRQAIIKNPKGGPYSDLVKAAEKCTASVIHPGLPADRSEKDIEKWIKRGEKFN
jgi:pyruvate-ferredoxin/flavodoxin oxidoreductase